MAAAVAYVCSELLPNFPLPNSMKLSKYQENITHSRELSLAVRVVLLGRLAVLLAAGQLVAGRHRGARGAVQRRLLGRTVQLRGSVVGDVGES